MILNLKSLVDKFDETMREMVEAAAALCVTRTHYEVEIEHFLLKELSREKSDIARILQHYGAKPDQLVTDLNHSLDRLKTGNTRGPSFSPMLVKLFTASWTLSSLHYGRNQLQVGYVFAAMLTDESLARVARDLSKTLSVLPSDSLVAELPNILAISFDDDEGDQNVSAVNDRQTIGVVANQEQTENRREHAGSLPLLGKYATNLTEAAHRGRFDAVIGRDSEIRQIIDVLMRRRQNNPILTGEAGVGKTAVVEGLALRIADGDVPPALRTVQLYSLDLTLLQAGASVKGEFENRLKGLIAEVTGSAYPVILFIDEAHTMIGAGGQPGQGDAANILKPALARGELRTIAATTWSEYKRYFEKDPALTRRFHVVKVEEPSEVQCEAMLRGSVSSLEKHHGVRILDEALGAAVRFSHRYLPGRQLPDKAISLLDTACARVALSRSSTPAVLDVVQHRIIVLKARAILLEREQATGAQHGQRLMDIKNELQEQEEEYIRLEARWNKEAELLRQLDELSTRLEADQNSNRAGRGDDLIELASLRCSLQRLQQNSPLTHPAVDSQIVAQVLSEWTGLPIGKMLDDEILKILHLEEGLKQRVIGQEHALAAIAQRVQTSRANLDDPSKPVGVFLLVGSSGVGKTETAHALAELLYGGEDNLITLNMSEFQEPHSVSTLKGAPPGYVGYGEGGVLTEAVRRQPYSVVLLDEVEKAHVDVIELFFQVFDKGYMEDGEGRSIDFRNTLILLTTNAASDTIARLTTDAASSPDPAELVAAIRPGLNRMFKPAFVGRTLVVPYYPVRDEVLEQIIRLKLERIVARLLQNHGLQLYYSEELVDLVRQRCIEVESGARTVDQLLANTLLPAISRQILERMISKEQSVEQAREIRVDVGENGEFRYDWSSGDTSMLATMI